MAITLYEADDAVLSNLTIDQLRAIYRSYHRAALHGISRVEVDGQVKSANPKTPIKWIEALRKVTGKCEKCSGTGIYSWGACINGKMTHSGDCFRCNGKGYVDLDDCRRNYGYDVRAINNAFKGNN